MKQRLSVFFATACYLGLIPGAPGTYASLATAAVLYGLADQLDPSLHLSAFCLITALGVLASAEVARARALTDPQIIVIDEVAGQLVTLVFLPINVTNLILGTLFFRAFDIWKPYPIRKLEHLPNGVGIMADDVLAGIYANLLLQLVNWSLPR